MHDNFRWLFISSIVLFFSCSEDPDCSQDIPHDQIIVTFYDKDELELKQAEFDYVFNADGTFIHNKDSADAPDSFSSIQLELNPSSDTSLFFFVTGVKTDTLRLIYSRKMEWLSVECGPNFTYDELMIFDHTFDSASLINSIIEPEIDESVRLFN